MVKTNYRYDPAKLEYHKVERAFLKKNMSKRQRRSSYVLFLPGREAVEWWRVLEPLGFDPERVYGVESDPEIHAALVEEDWGFQLTKNPMTLVDFLKSRESRRGKKPIKFNFINYDSYSKTSTVLQDMGQIVRDQRIAREGVVATNIYGARDERDAFFNRKAALTTTSLHFNGDPDSITNQLIDENTSERLTEQHLERSFEHTDKLLALLRRGRYYGKGHPLYKSILDANPDIIDIAVEAYGNHIVNLYMEMSDWSEIVDVISQKSDVDREVAEDVFGVLKEEMRQMNIEALRRNIAEKGPSVTYMCVPMQDNPYKHRFVEMLLDDPGFFPGLYLSTFHAHHAVREQMASSTFFALRDSEGHPYLPVDIMRGKYISDTAAPMYFDFFSVKQFRSELNIRDMVKFKDGRVRIKNTPNIPRDISKAALFALALEKKWIHTSTAPDGSLQITPRTPKSFSLFAGTLERIYNAEDQAIHTHYGQIPTMLNLGSFTGQTLERFPGKSEGLFELLHDPSFRVNPSRVIDPGLDGAVLFEGKYHRLNAEGYNKELNQAIAKAGLSKEEAIRILGGAGFEVNKMSIAGFKAKMTRMSGK